MLKSIFTLCALFSLVAAPLSSASAAADGKAVWDKHCKKCHAEDGTGKKAGEWLPVCKTLKLADGCPGLDVLTDQSKKNYPTAEAITKLVLEGKEKMKPMKDKMTEEEAKASADYTLTLQAAKK